MRTLMSMHAQRKILIRLCAIVAPIFLLMLAGCGSEIHGQIRPAAPNSWTDTDWATVLQQAVTSDGYVKYDILKLDKSPAREALVRYVAQIGAESPMNDPGLFPSLQDQRAYYINAYNAICMNAALEKGSAPMSGAGAAPSAEAQAAGGPVAAGPVAAGSSTGAVLYSVGGRKMTLDALRDQYIRSTGDARMLVAINSMCRSSPPLAREPYTGMQLDDQLNAQFSRFLSDPRGAILDGDTVKLSAIFTQFYPADFINAYQRKSGKAHATIIDALRRYALPDSPVTRASKFAIIPFDRSINSAR